MIVKCASCGWTDEEISVSESDATFKGATHLANCSERDDLRYVPWWTTRPTNFSGDTVLEVGWHPLNVNDPTFVTVTDWSHPQRPTRVEQRVYTERFRFTEYADRVLIGVRRASGDAEVERLAEAVRAAIASTEARA